MTKEQTAQNTPEFLIHRIYVKDISFESPNSPHTFQGEWQPNVNVELSTDAKVLEPDVHEVVLSVTVTVKLAEKTAFLAEIHQAGIFTVKGLEGAELGQMLGSFCPNILFPYAREAVSDVVTRGGYPQLLLAPVNFDALYAQHLEQQAKKAQAADKTATAAKEETTH